MAPRGFHEPGRGFHEPGRSPAHPQHPHRAPADFTNLRFHEPGSAPGGHQAAGGRRVGRISRTWVGDTGSSVPGGWHLGGFVSSALRGRSRDSPASCFRAPLWRAPPRSRGLRPVGGPQPRTGRTNLGQFFWFFCSSFGSFVCPFAPVCPRPHEPGSVCPFPHEPGAVLGSNLGRFSVLAPAAD